MRRPKNICKPPTKISASHPHVNRPAHLAHHLPHLAHGRGHILTMSPKCHPELAGHGIEYCWGASKLYFRRHNDLVPKNFFKNVLKSIDVITRSQVHMFERRARAYRTALKDEALNTFDLVEKAVAKRKAHRNAVDFDSGFIKRVMAMR